MRRALLRDRMTTIDDAIPTDAAAPRVVTLKPSAFADTWKFKPATEVAVGLRLVSSEVVENARAVAAKQAYEWHADKDTGRIRDPDAYAESYNDTLMRRVVARAACDVNDRSKPYFKAAEETVRAALTAEGVRRLWDELLILHAESSVAIALADDEDLARLARVLLRGRAIASLPESDRLEARTLLAYVLTMLVGTGEAHEADVAPKSAYRMTVVA